jgi:tetratricopeptide (TPR) repeat protein
MAKMELNNGNLVQGWKLANRAYLLQPDNPEDIAALAATWVLLGDTGEAERLVLKGLENANQNASLLETHWMALLVAHRYEEAELLLREQMTEFGDNIPDALQRRFNFQLGMIALARGDHALARDLLVSAISDEDDPAYSGDEVMTITMAACATELVGEKEAAADLLARADRQIQRARLNGVDNPDIYYNEAVLLTMRNEPQKAMEKLRESYARGFRELWVLDIDTRLAALRDKPEFIALTEQMRDDVNKARAEIESMSVATL